MPRSGRALPTLQTRHRAPPPRSLPPALSAMRGAQPDVGRVGDASAAMPGQRAAPFGGLVRSVRLPDALVIALPAMAKDRRVRAR